MLVKNLYRTIASFGGYRRPQTPAGVPNNLTYVVSCCLLLIICHFLKNKLPSAINYPNY